jgi:dUTP pyrophosphatase
MAAGLDLKSAYDHTIPAYRKGLVGTDLSIRVPSGCYGRIAPRSGLAIDYHISVGGGVIDADYCGNVCVILFSHSVTPFHVRRGDRIAQLICELCILTYVRCRNWLQLNVILGDLSKQGVTKCPCKCMFK